MAVCNVQNIFAPNGKPSELFRNINDITGDQAKSLDIWLTTKTQGFIESFPDINYDDNGEVFISEIYKDETFILEQDPNVNDLVGYNSLKSIIIDKLDNAVRGNRGIYKKNGDYYLTSSKIVEGKKVLAEINTVESFVRSSKIRGNNTEIHKIFINEANVRRFTNEFDKRDQEANEVVDLNLETNENINDLVEKRPAEPDKFTSVISRLRENKRLLQLKRREDPQRTADIKTRIDNIDKEIEQLMKEKSISTIKVVARNHIADISQHMALIEKNVNKTLNADQLLNFMDNLMENSYFIKSWLDTHDIIPFDEGTDSEKEVDQIKSEFDRLNRKYFTLQKKLFVKFINLEGYSNEFTEDKLFSYIHDTSALTKNFLSSTASNSELVRVTTDVLKNADWVANKEFTHMKNVIGDMIRKNEKMTGLKGEKAWDWVIQKYKDGKTTGNLMNQYQQEYFQERTKRKEEAKKSENWKEYFKWLKENADTITEKEALSGESTIFNKEELKKQKELLEKYEVDKASKLQSLEVRELTEDQIHTQMTIWEDINSPFVYWQFLRGDIKYKQARKSYKYILYEKPKTQWHDTNFKKMYNIETGEIINKEKYDIYNKIKDIISKNNEKLPTNYEQQRNYLPETKRDLAYIDRLKSAPDFIKTLYSEEAELDVDARINIAGETVKTVPVSMMNGKLDIEEKSLDVGNVLLKHTQMALSYEHKSRIQVVAEAAKDILINKVKEAELNQGRNLYRKDANGLVLLKGNKLYRTKEHLEYAINAYLYNEYKDTGEFASNKRVLTSKDKKTLEELGISDNEVEDKKKELADKWNKGEITDDYYYKEIGKLNGIGRLVTGGAIGDTIIKWTYLKALSLPNFISPAVNLSFGMIQNHIYAASGIDYNSKTLFAGINVMLAATTKKGIEKLGKDGHSKLVNKTYGFMDVLDLLGDSINETKYGGSKSVGEKLVALQIGAEVLNQGSLMVAMLKHEKLKDKNGNEISIWDAYTTDEVGNLVWDTNKMGEQGETSAQELINKARNGVNLYRMANKLGAVIARVHGDYKSPMAAKKSIIGRALMLFRTWLPAAIDERFGKERFDPDLGRYRLGKYRSFLNPKNANGDNLGFPETLKTLLRIISFQQNKYGEIRKEDIENIKKDLRGMIYIATLYVAALFLKALIDDDDEKAKVLYTLANIHNKIIADLLFAVNPASAGQIVDNAVPIYKTVKDFFGIVPITMDALEGDLYYDNGYWKDRLKFEKWLYVNLPGSSGVVKIIASGHQVYDY